MKADLRISIKDNRRQKLLRVYLLRTPFGPGRFWVRMAEGARGRAERWPKDGAPVSLSRLMAALRKAMVKANASPAIPAASSQAG